MRLPTPLATCRTLCLTWTALYRFCLIGILLSGGRLGWRVWGRPYRADMYYLSLPQGFLRDAGHCLCKLPCPLADLGVLLSPFLLSAYVWLIVKSKAEERWPELLVLFTTVFLLVHYFRNAGTIGDCWE